MFTLEEVKEFLKELELPINEENIKWGYKTLLKEQKVFIKMREFEATFDEDLYCCDACCDACNCDEDCQCDCCKDGCNCDEKCTCKCCCSK